MIESTYFAPEMLFKDFQYQYRTYRYKYSNKYKNFNN